MLTRKGQNLAEYAILIAIVIGAAVTMQVYLKRGLQGKQADAMDFGPSLNLGGGATMRFPTKQYEPYYVDSDANIRRQGWHNENITERGASTKTGILEDTRKFRGARESQIWQSYTAR